MTEAEDAEWEHLTATRHTRRLRVPGGWIYQIPYHTTDDPAGIVVHADSGVVFVPDPPKE